MKKTFFLTLILIFSNLYIYASNDSMKTKNLLALSYIPTILLSSGILLNNSRFEKKLKVEIRNTVGNDFDYKIDDYLKDLPIYELYIADVIGIQSKNHWFEQTKYLLFSNIISAGFTYYAKRIIVKTRPNGTMYSMPSGHTTYAFTNSSVLYNEFIDTSPILAYSGHLIASTTGAFRIINNKHWLSDVLVGAGIGILATNLVYYFEPLKDWNPFIKSKNITLQTSINYNIYFIYFQYKY